MRRMQTDLAVKLKQPSQSDAEMTQSVKFLNCTEKHTKMHQYGLKKVSLTNLDFFEANKRCFGEWVAHFHILAQSCYG